MRRYHSNRPSAPQTSRRPDASEESRRVLLRVEELKPLARLGDTPEEIFAKGEALIEIDRLRPWRFDGTGSKGRWCKKNLPYRVARANQYIRIASGVSLQRVAGTSLHFEHLLVLAGAPESLHDKLIAAAQAGGSAPMLARLAKGEGEQTRDVQFYLDRAAGSLARSRAALLHAVSGVEVGGSFEPEPLRQCRETLLQQLALLDPYLQQAEPSEAGTTPPPERWAVEPTPGPAAPVATAPPAPPPAAPAASAKVDPHGSVSAPAGAAPPPAASAKVDPHGSVSAPDEPVALAGAALPVSPAAAGAPPEIDRQTALRLLGAPYVPAPLPPPVGIPVHEDWPATWRTQYLSSRKTDNPILLCSNGPSPQQGTLALSTDGGLRVGLDFNGNFAAFLFGTPGSCKTYTCNVITHMALCGLRNINALPAPLCAVAIHHHPDDSHDPEALSLRFPNRDGREIRYLVEEVGGMPEGLEDIVLLCPDSRVEIMRKRYPHIEVQPLCYATHEVGATEFQLLLGLDESNDHRIYTRQIRMAMRKVARSGPMNLVELEHALLAEGLTGEAANRVKTRLHFAREHICDDLPLLQKRRAGRLIVVDTRDPWLTRQESMMLGTLTLSILLRRTVDQDFNMLARVDEVADLLKDPGFRALADMMLRKRRHLRVSPLFATQHAQHVPLEMLSNADLIGVGRMQSEDALRYLTRAKEAFRTLMPEQTAALQDGEMFVWAERRFLEGKVPPEVHAELLRVQIRSQTAQHGGATYLAVEEGPEDELDLEDEDEDDESDDREDEAARTDEHAAVADALTASPDQPAAGQDEESDDYEDFLLDLNPDSEPDPDQQT